MTTEMKNSDLYSYLRCVRCGSALSTAMSRTTSCTGCDLSWEHVNESPIPRFTEAGLHSNFGLQWQVFSTTQLDSVNGSSESENRLLHQSQLTQSDFSNKVILEIGCGNGRFTELLLRYGAKVVAVDYSEAVLANLKNNKSYFESGKLLLLQADLFELPLVKEAFDIVIVYGVIQHTGNNFRALSASASYVKVGGRLLVDVYSTSLKHFNPLIYCMRSIVRLLRLTDGQLLRFVKGYVSVVFGPQYLLLRLLHNKGGILKWLRYAVNRSPSSVYGINLLLDGVISKEVARDWCVLDTFDAWGPKFDHPLSNGAWRKLLQRLESRGLITEAVIESGQGNVAKLRRIYSFE